jgi:hypothetical protein
MKSRARGQNWLKESRKGWIWLTQGAAWIGGVLGGFLLPPPVGISTSDDKIWLRLGQFVIAIIVGLVFLAARRWNQPRHAFLWGGVSLVALVIAIGAFFRYQQLSLNWTANYGGGKVVVGSALTPQGQAAFAKNPGATAEWLIDGVAGSIETICTRESINRRRLILAGTYVSCLPLFGICLISVVEAIQCGVRNPSRKRRRSHRRA